MDPMKWEGVKESNNRPREQETVMDELKVLPGQMVEEKALWKRPWK